MNKAPLTIARAMELRRLWGPLFDDPSWWGWKSFMRVFEGQPLNEQQLALFRECTGRTEAPTQAFAEAVLICGRRSGKSRALAIIAAFLAVCRDWRPFLAEGEQATVAVLAADRAQATLLLRYIRALLESVPEFKAHMGPAHSQRITLPDLQVTIEIQTASFQLARSRSCCAILADECAFWQTSEESAQPDTEIIRALRPSLLTLRPAGSVLLMASSPYRRDGVLWEAYRKHYGVNGATTLVWKSPSARMNPSLPQAEIDKAFEEDPDAASSEFGAEFRRDVSSLLDRATVESLVVPGRGELLPTCGVQYKAFVDPSGGSSDSMTLCIGHSEVRDNVQYAVIDLLREIRAPFDPDSACKEFADCLMTYNLREAMGDRYAGTWPASRFAAHGITYIEAEQPKSAIYLSALPLINSRRVELPDNPRLVAQLCSLERRTGRGTGRDVIDHAPRQHDDLANVACALATIVAGQPSNLDIWAACIGQGPLAGRWSATAGFAKF